MERRPAGRWLEETVRQAEVLQWRGANLLARAAQLHGQHAVARCGRYEHEPLARGARAVSRSSLSWSLLCVLRTPAGPTADKRPKALLIAALRDLLPTEVAEQRKRTFTLPWEEWMRGALRGRISAAFSEWSPRLEAHVPGAAARGVWDAFLAGRTSWSRPWALYVLNEWVRHNLESIGAPAQISKATSVMPAVT